MIEQISGDIETILDTNNNNKSFKSSANSRKHTDSLTQLFDPKLKYKRRATSLNDLSVSFKANIQHISSFNIKDTTNTNCCLNCQSKSTTSEISLLNLNRKTNDTIHSRDCCHACFLHADRSNSNPRIENDDGIDDLRLSMFENSFDQKVPVEEKRKTNNNTMNFKQNTSFNASSNEFENFNSLTFYKQCYVS